MGSDLTLSSSDLNAKGGRSSFFYSFSFLPKPKRDAIKTVYQFCRTTDDLVDNSGDVTTNIERLTKWRWELDRAIKGTSEYAILNQLMEIARRFNIPVSRFHELIRGVEMDLVKKRYETFDELREYCLLVASSVGLMCLEIFRPRNAATREYAVNLGIALQLTNIIRDVAIDASFGRIYLPIEDLRKFGYTESDVFAHNYTPEFRALMEFETNRAEEYFKRAQELLPREDRRPMFAAKIMERIYYHTLLRIKEADYNVYERSVSLPRYLQFLIAVKYWLKHFLFSA
jgi:15-cis-phytoene synthase